MELLAALEASPLLFPAVLSGKALRTTAVFAFVSLSFTVTGCTPHPIFLPRYLCSEGKDKR